MRALGVLALLAVGCGSDSECVTSTTWCADGAVMRCMGDHAELVEDCRTLSDELGVAKACSGFKNGEDRHCVDVQKQACDTLDAIECAPNRMARRICVSTDFGMTWDSRSLQPDCTEDQQCFPSDTNKFACVTPPVVPCPELSHCDQNTLIRCDGNATAGYVVVEHRNCPTSCEAGSGMFMCN